MGAENWKLCLSMTAAAMSLFSFPFDILKQQHLLFPVSDSCIYLSPCSSKNPFPKVSSHSPWSDITILTQDLISFTAQLLFSLCPGHAPHLALIHDLKFTWGWVSSGCVLFSMDLESVTPAGSHSLLAPWVVPWTCILKLMHFGFWEKAN